MILVRSYPRLPAVESDFAEYFRAAGEGVFGLGEAEAQHAVRRRLAVEHRHRDRGDLAQHLGVASDYEVLVEAASAG